MDNDPLSLFNEGYRLHQQGAFPQAESLYRKVLAHQPDQVGALHMLGMLQAQRGRLAEANATLIRATHTAPDDSSVWNNLGSIQFAMGQFDDALRSFEKVAALNPAAPEAFYNQGNALRELGRHDEALACFEKAIALKPDYYEAFFNRATILRMLGRRDEALASYASVIALKPDIVMAYNSHGSLLRELKRPDDALTSFEKAIALKPDDAEAHNNLALALSDLNRHEQALASYDHAIALAPGYAEAHNNRGVTLGECRRYDEALASYQQAIALNPRYAEAYNNRGTELNELGRYIEALAQFDMAIQLAPNYAEAHGNRGVALTHLKHYDEALASYDRCIALKPDDAEAYMNRGVTLTSLKRHVEAFASLDRANSLNPELPYLPGTLLSAAMDICHWQGWEQTCQAVLNGIENGWRVTTPYPLLSIPANLLHLRSCAEGFIADKYPISDQPLWRGARCSHKRLRVGYFSSDFRDHPVTHLAAGLFEKHDRSQFEIFAFSFGPDTQDAMRDRAVRAFDHFHDVRLETDTAVAEWVRTLEIDIAVDLNGFTSDARTGIFARRPAPIQVNYLGYPGTLGAAYIDYLIADGTIIPNEHREAYAEKIIFLPDSYQVNDKSRSISSTPTRAQAELPETGFVFCCFNNNYKITPDVFDLWMRLLAKVEGSVLWLYEDKPAATLNLRREAEKRGVDAKRLIFAKRVALHADHLARYQLADLFLDTFYFNAHTTASDALWAGLPVLTCLGDKLAGRVAASLLNAIGLPELITRTVQEYEAVAVRLATQPMLLAEIKNRLIQNRVTHALFDTTRFTRQLEAAYLEIWERQRRGEAPEDVYIRSA